MERMEWRHGMNTPVHVPSFFGSFLLCVEDDADGEEFLELEEESFLAGDDKK